MSITWPAEWAFQGWIMQTWYAQLGHMRDYVMLQHDAVCVANCMQTLQSNQINRLKLSISMCVAALQHSMGLSKQEICFSAHRALFICPGWVLKLQTYVCAVLVYMIICDLSAVLTVGIPHTDVFPTTICTQQPYTRNGAQHWCEKGWLWCSGTQNLCTVCWLCFDLG